MSDKLIINSNIAISKTAEASLGTFKTLAADYQGAVTNALNIQIPGVEKLLNAGIIGDGDEWATQADADYQRHTGMTFADRLNVSQFANLIARLLSGTITSTETGASSGVYDHVIEMKASDLDPQLQSSSVAFELGGFDFILAGMVANTLNLSVQGGAAPTYQIETVGTGRYDFMSAQTPALVLPDPADQIYVGQRSQTTVSFDDGTVFDITGDGRLDSLQLQLSNNVITGERRIGDPLQDSTDLNSGAYVRQLTRGDQRTLSLSMGVYVSTDQRGYLAHINNTEIADLTYMSRGNVEIGTALYPEVEFTIPKSTIMIPELGGDRKGMITLNFEALKDAAEDGIIRFRIRNASPTLT